MVHAFAVKNYFIKILIFYQIFNIFTFLLQFTISITFLQDLWKGRQIRLKILHSVYKKHALIFIFLKRKFNISMNTHADITQMNSNIIQCSHIHLYSLMSFSVYFRGPTFFYCLEVLKKFDRTSGGMKPNV